MKIFQRFEVWLLVLLAAGATVWVFKSSPIKEEEPGKDSQTPTPRVTNASPAGPNAQGSLTVQRLSLERDFGNARLDIDVHLTNQHTKKLQLVKPTLKLVTAAGRVVPEFFLPVEPPPEIPAETTADAHLRYWLDKADLASGLSLQFEGQTVKLKSDKPFDLEQLKNAEPKALTLADW